MQPQRPQRPVTRVPQSAAGKPTTSRHSPVKPPTQRVHTAPTTRMPTESGRGGSRPVARTTRGAASGKKSNLPILLGGGAGLFVLIIVVAVAASGGGKKAPEKAAPKPKVMDVAGMEDEGKRKCEEGVVMIQRAYNIPDKGGLQRGVQLITEGNQLLDKANQLSGHTYDTKKFNETLKMARGKLLELK